MFDREPAPDVDPDDFDRIKAALGLSSWKEVATPQEIMPRVWETLKSLGRCTEPGCRRLAPCPKTHARHLTVSIKAKDSAIQSLETAYDAWMEYAKFQHPGLKTEHLIALLGGSSPILASAEKIREVTVALKNAVRNDREADHDMIRHANIIIAKALPKGAQP